ncbi:unnamed protein product [Adineta steineri]|uniref:Tetraspanin n=1 Tax=Adineta steineri TaxID=433720 RepID=A0A815E3S8_9BILA|nr:unnamed protein product [Adineta steineri]
MGIATCYPCAKYLLLVLNLFFWLSVQQIIHLFNFTNLPLSSIEILACIIILFGIIIFLIGLFGYCGAKRESRTCLILYIVLITSILLVELALFIFIAMHYEQGQSLVKQRLVSQMKKYNHMYPSQYERAIDYIQSKYHCCGVDTAYDYSDSHVPLSCCSMTSTVSCTVHEVGLTGTPGCLPILTRATFFWGKLFLLIEFSLCVLALIGVFLAICVCQNTMLYDDYAPAPYHI